MSKFGEVLAKAEKAVAAKFQDPAMRKMAAARVSLGYAVIATARERALGAEVVAGALSGATVAQQAMLIKEGRAARGCATARSLTFWWVRWPARWSKLRCPEAWARTRRWTKSYGTDLPF